MDGLIARRVSLIRHWLRRAGVVTLATIGGFIVVAVAAVPVWAQENVPDFEITEEKAPELDYTLSAGTAVLTFGLLIAFFILVFWMSEREFKGVINERFGPKR